MTDRTRSRSVALRRTLTARTESHHSTIDALQADRHRVQNKMTRIQRSGDIRWAMMNDEFEYADLRQKFAVDAVRNFEESKWNRIDDIAPSDCSQDDNGRWSCFFKNSAKDCESGDIMRWDSVEEATKYPVQCRAPIGRDAPLMQHGGEGDAAAASVRTSVGPKLTSSTPSSKPRSDSQMTRSSASSDSKVDLGTC